MGVAYEKFLESEVNRLKADLAQETKTRLKVMAERDKLLVLVLRAKVLFEGKQLWMEEAQEALKTIFEESVQSVSQPEKEDNRKAFYDAFGLTGREV